MATFSSLQKKALAFPEVREEPHFEKTSFRVGGKIFATFNVKTGLACLKLSPSDQDVFSLVAPGRIYPVPSAWGKQGWTFVEIKAIQAAQLSALLKAAYTGVAAAKRSARSK